MLMVRNTQKTLLKIGNKSSQSQIIQRGEQSQRLRADWRVAVEKEEEEESAAMISISLF